MPPNFKPFSIGTYRTCPLPTKPIPPPPALDRPNPYSHVKSKLAETIGSQLKK